MKTMAQRQETNKSEYLYVIEIDGISRFDINEHMQLDIPKDYIDTHELHRVRITHDADAMKCESLGPNQGFKNEFRFRLFKDDIEHVNAWAKFFANRRYILLIPRKGFLQVMYSRFCRCRVSFEGSHPSYHTFKAECYQLQYPFVYANVSAVSLDSIIETE